jgi:hypothetical protein
MLALTVDVKYMENYSPSAFTDSLAPQGKTYLR